MIRHPPISTLTATLVPHPPFFRSLSEGTWNNYIDARLTIKERRLMDLVDTDEIPLLTAAPTRTASTISGRSSNLMNAAKPADGLLSGGQTRSEEHKSELQSLLRI